LRFRPGDPSLCRYHADQAERNRAANLVRQLLAFSRQQTLQPRIIDITDVLVELSHLLRRLIGENIELKVVHGRDLGLAKVGSGQLEQVIINLAVNARDAMQGGGTLTIRTSNISQASAVRRWARGDAGRRLCADRGLRYRRRAFEGGISPASSSRSSRRRRRLRTGARLSTVYGIVKQTGVSSSSTAPPGAAPGSRSICRATS